LTATRIRVLTRARAPSSRPSPNRDYFPALDGLRAVAFLMVFGQHYLQLPWGWGGVDVFFVLSGFLITGILFDSRDDLHRVRNFYIRRTLRIFPLYYGLMLVLALLYPVFRWQWSWGWLAWPAYAGNFVLGFHRLAAGSPLELLAAAQLLSRTHPRTELYFGHFWSLCVEEQFYLLWPWVVFRLRDRNKLLWICIACVAACPLLRVLASHVLPQYTLDQQVLYHWTPFRIDALLLGGCIALVRRGPSPRALLTGARAGFGVLFGTLLLWLALNPAARHLPKGYVYPTWQFTWGLSFIDLFAACVMVMALESGSVTCRLFSLRPLRWLGRVSYGAYVFHDILHIELMRLVTYYHYAGHWRYRVAALALGLTMLAAWASFRWFEMPFIRLKDRWTRQSADMEVEPSQAALEPARRDAVA